METHRIEAQPRAGRGKGAARALRRGGSIPAVLYGAGVENQPLSVDPEALGQLARSPLGWNSPVTVSVGGADHLAMISELQRHPVSRAPLHADFRVVGEDEKVVVTVPLRTEGKSKGEQAGGKLKIFTRYVKVRCTPGRIPAAVIVDVTELDDGARVTATDLRPGEGIEIAFERSFPVIEVSGGSKAAEAVAAAPEPTKKKK